MEISLVRASILWTVSWWPSGPETGHNIQYQLLTGEDFLNLQGVNDNFPESTQDEVILNWLPNDKFHISCIVSRTFIVILTL
jgi:hypothetical protein